MAIDENPPKKSKLKRSDWIILLFILILAAAAGYGISLLVTWLAIFWVEM